MENKKIFLVGFLVLIFGVLFYIPLTSASCNFEMNMPQVAWYSWGDEHKGENNNNNNNFWDSHDKEHGSMDSFWESKRKMPSHMMEGKSAFQWEEMQNRGAFSNMHRENSHNKRGWFWNFFH
tara:strand:- start:487 stop:852 length:366 start_codon:yes stop_codon:yes gene_type:complete